MAQQLTAKIWSRGYARAALMGPERTMNPSPAATAILKQKLGAKAVARAVKKAGKRRKSFHRGNPLPAAIALLAKGGIQEAVTGALSKLGIGSKFTKDSHVARFQKALAEGNTAVATTLMAQAAAHAAAPIPDQADWAARLAQMQALMPKKAGAAAAPTALEQTMAALTNPGVIRTIASAAKPRRQARGRYPTYTDRYGRQRYSTKPPGQEMRIPAGAVPSPGTPYSFFRGAVGKGGAAATAGQVALAAGAGIAAYLVTQKLLQYLGGSAQRAEEAGVNAARAFREARADLARQQGKPITPAQVREMGAAYKAKLIELGYDPVTFTRKRGAVSNFLEAYNPLGG